jgi:hypothetical protein
MLKIFPTLFRLILWALAKDRLSAWRPLKSEFLVKKKTRLIQQFQSHHWNYLKFPFLKHAFMQWHEQSPSVGQNQLLRLSEYPRIRLRFYLDFYEQRFSLLEGWSNQTDNFSILKYMCSSFSNWFGTIQRRHTSPNFFATSFSIFTKRRRNSHLTKEMKDTAANWSKGKVNNAWNLKYIMIA